LEVFPNPVHDILSFHVRKKHTDAEYTIRIMNMAGQVLLTKNGKTLVGEYNTANLAAGIYIIQVSIDNEVLTERFVKQ
jgi:hypothetical protein